MRFLCDITGYETGGVTAVLLAGVTRGVAGGVLLVGLVQQVRWGHGHVLVLTTQL